MYQTFTLSPTPRNLSCTLRVFLHVTPLYSLPVTSHVLLCVPPMFPYVYHPSKYSPCTPAMLHLPPVPFHVPPPSLTFSSTYPARAPFLVTPSSFLPFHVSHTTSSSTLSFTRPSKVLCHDLPRALPHVLSSLRQASTPVNGSLLPWLPTPSTPSCTT